MSERWDELLRRDHEITERVFAAMEKLFAAPAGPAPAQVGQFVEYVRDYVDRCHNQKEEQHLFPRLEQKGMPRDGGPLGVMLQEHARAQQILARLVPSGAAFAAGDRDALDGFRAAFAEYAALCKDHREVEIEVGCDGPTQEDRRERVIDQEQRVDHEAPGIHGCEQARAVTIRCTAQADHSRQNRDSGDQSLGRALALRSHRPPPRTRSRFRSRD